MLLTHLTGQYLYIDSSLPSVKGNVAQIKSSLLPPAGEKGYCFSFWYHMFGATVGTLKMVLQTPNNRTKTLVKELYPHANTIAEYSYVSDKRENSYVGH